MKKQFAFLLLLAPSRLALAAEECPANSHPDIFGRGCVCNTGYVVENEACVKVRVPANAHPNYLGGWECDHGYTKAGDECASVQLPPNASFTFGGNWTCNQGYERNGNGCAQVVLPDNAHFTFGAMWECDPGYKKDGGQCFEMNKQELIEKTKLLNLMLYMQMSKSTGGDCSSGFDACEDECDDQFSSYSDQQKCEDACDEGKDACN